MIIDGIRQILKNCIQTRVNLEELSLFDIEYIFLRSVVDLLVKKSR